MIVVDSSVWIAYFNGTATPESEVLDKLLGSELVAIGNLMLAEVLQGFQNDSDFRQARRKLTSLTVIEIAGTEVAVQAAKNYRVLRSRGVTVRKTIDTLIATRCIRDGHTLLHSDRDFDAFEKYLRLRVAKPADYE